MEDHSLYGRDKQECLPGNEISVNQVKHAEMCRAGKVSCRREYLTIMEKSSESKGGVRFWGVMKSSQLIWAWHSDNVK